MMASQRSLSGVIVLAGLAMVVVGCQEESTTAPQTRAVAALTAAKTDRYIVVLKEGRPASAMTTMSVDASRMGAAIERSHSEIGVLQVRATAAVAAQLARRPDVEAVGRDFKIQLPPHQRSAKVRHFEVATNQRGAAAFKEFQWNLRRIQAPKAWDVSRQGKGVSVALLDTGIDPRHIELVGKLDFGSSVSFVASERADRDFFSHGTDNASIISSKGIVIGSVAPDSRVISVKVCDGGGSCQESDILAAIMYVGTLGVDVANMSFGSGPLSLKDPDVRAAARANQRAIDFATRRGVLFVASAGNDATNLNSPDVIHLPSGLNHVISVGATGPIGQKRFDHLTSFTNFGGREVDVFAPGGEFQFPGNVAQDLILVACSPSIDYPGFDCADRQSYLLDAGTSQAAPHVAAEAAVIESTLPGDQTPAELTECILKSADPLPNPQFTGHGRINVFRGQACRGS